MRNYYGEIGAILGAGAAPYATIPLGDPFYENAARTTVTTKGAGALDGLVFTYSEARTAFDLPTTYAGRGRLARVPFNGTDEEADSPDAAPWTRALAPFSFGIWIKASALSSPTLFGKFDTTDDNREYLWGFSGAKHQLVLYDEDHATNEFIRSRDDADTRVGVWVFLIATSDGSANASGINLYTAGALRASTDLDQAGFASMRANPEEVTLAHFDAGNPTGVYGGDMRGGPIGPFFSHRELSAQDARLLHLIGLDAQRDLPLLDRIRGMS